MRFEQLKVRFNRSQNQILALQGILEGFLLFNLPRGTDPGSCGPKVIHQLIEIEAGLSGVISLALPDITFNILPAGCSTDTQGRIIG